MSYFKNSRRFPNILSDHFLLEISLFAKHFIESNDIEKDHDFINRVYKWDKCLKDKYIESVSSATFRNSLFDLTHTIRNADSKMDVDVSLSLFIAASDKVCCPLFGKTIFESNDTGKTFSKQNAVLNFDASCNDKRKKIQEVKYI